MERIYYNICKVYIYIYIYINIYKYIYIYNVCIHEMYYMYTYMHIGLHSLYGVTIIS